MTVAYLTGAGILDIKTKGLRGAEGGNGANGGGGCGYRGRVRHEKASCKSETYTTELKFYKTIQI